MRNKALECLHRAKDLIAKNDEASAKYACLELRFCIEYITYSHLQTYLNEVSNETMKKWQPKNIIEDLLEIDPDIDKDTEFLLGIQEQLGVPAREMNSLGTEQRFSLRLVKNQYHAIGSFLHVPTLLQIEQEKIPTKEKTLAKAKEVIKEIEQILDSPIFNVKIKYYAGIFQCKFCQEDVKYCSKDFNNNVVYCSKCKAIYDIILNGDNYSFQARKYYYKCHSCETVNSVGYHLIYIDNIISCSNCNKEEKIQYQTIPL